MPSSSDDDQQQAAYSLLLDQAMQAQTQAEADTIFADLVTLLRGLRPHAPVAVVMETLREALGYNAGYFTDDIRKRVERFYRCAHPFFGAIAHVPPPTLREQHELGLENNRRHRNGEPFITLAEFRAQRGDAS